MAAIPGGRYAPFYPVKGELPREIAPFWLDERPVTNAEYLQFVRAERPLAALASHAPLRRGFLPVGLGG